MHDGLFQHRGGQSPAGEVLLATVLDEAPGDVVAEPLPGFLFGVARRQPVPGVLALFTVGDVYASLCKRGAYAPFSAQRRSRALFWL